MALTAKEKREAKSEYAWKRELDPFAERYSGIFHRLTDMTPAQLQSLREACGRATSTNCWWAIYRVAGILIPEIDSRLRMAPTVDTTERKGKPTARKRGSRATRVRR